MASKHAEVELLAYHLWEARGRPAGSGVEDWVAAERQLAAKSFGSAASSNAALDVTLKESFPASDPPASHIEDIPPVNADAKWAAAGTTRKGAAAKAAIENSPAAKAAAAKPAVARPAASTPAAPKPAASTPAPVKPAASKPSARSRIPKPAP